MTPRVVQRKRKEAIQKLVWSEKGKKGQGEGKKGGEPPSTSPRGERGEKKRVASTEGEKGEGSIRNKAGGGGGSTPGPKHPDTRQGKKKRSLKVITRKEKRKRTKGDGHRSSSSCAKGEKRKREKREKQCRLGLHQKEGEKEATPPSIGGGKKKKRWKGKFVFLRESYAGKEKKGEVFAGHRRREKKKKNLSACLGRPP